MVCVVLAIVWPSFLSKIVGSLARNDHCGFINLHQIWGVQHVGHHTQNFWSHVCQRRCSFVLEGFLKISWLETQRACRVQEAQHGSSNRSCSHSIFFFQLMLFFAPVRSSWWWWQSWMNVFVHQKLYSKRKEKTSAPKQQNRPNNQHTSKHKTQHW